MTRPIENPVTIPDTSPLGGERSTHPAFAKIGVNRVSGHAILAGSDFRHNSYMVIRIKRAEMHRSLSNDWSFGKEELIEVALSEAQWAAFVSSPNMGDGMLCTLQYLTGEGSIPGLPEPKTRVEQFGGEMKETMADAVARIDKAVAMIEGMGLPARKAAALLEEFRMAKQELLSNVPFVAEQFSEHMEDTTEKAKAEIHGYMTGVIHRAGLATLNNGVLPLQIEGPKGFDL